MKKYHVSSGYTDRLINKIEIGCFSNPNGTFCGSELSKLCLKPKNLYALHLLEASGEIRMSIPNNSEIPCAIWLENKGMLHSYTKYQSSISAIKGFLSGVVAGVLTTIIAEVVLFYLIPLLANTLP